MRTLVTGISGFSGSFVARALAEAGFDVVGVYRRDTPFLAPLVGEPNLRLLRADLSDARELPGPFEAVVHAAATSPAAGVSVERLLRDNVLANLALVAAAKDWRSRAFVLFSSLSVYGEVAAPVLDESCPIVNPDAYGATKRLAELLLAEEARDLPTLALRLPGVLGPGAHRNWLSGVAARLLSREPIRAYNLDAPFNNAAHVDDIARLVVAVLQRSWEGFDAVVLGAHGSTTVRGAIERLARGLGVPAKIVEEPPSKPAFTLLSSRAIECWGYDPMPIDAMLDRYAADVLEIERPKATRSAAAD
jgi:nucleoside-diphosphate-sugar epimerase